MHNKARQWPFQMTAGLSPVQLVHNHQLRQLFLLFSIKKDLYEGVIEPLMSQAVWKNGMGKIKQVACKKLVWPVSGLVSVSIGYDKEKKEIRVVVAFREDADKISEVGRAIAEVLGSITSIKFPQLRYVFNEDSAQSSFLNESKLG